MDPIRKETVPQPAGAKARVVWGRSANGRYLGEEFWENECDDHQQSKFQANFKVLQEHGWIKNREIFKFPLKGQKDIGEFKTFKKRLYCYRDGSDYIITHGETKKKDGTDDTEIERVKRIRNEIELQEQELLRRSTQTMQRGKGR